MSLRIAIVGAGTSGAHLLRRVSERPELDIVVVADPDPVAPGLALAAASGIPTSTDGFDAVFALEDAPDVVFAATTAAGRRSVGSRLSDASIRLVDMTPAGGGVVVVPSVNLPEVDDAAEISLATPAAQVTVPLVAAIGEIAHVQYAEAVSTVASIALGAGARGSVDENVRATAAALQRPGGAGAGKAISLVTPAEQPLRCTLFCLVSADSDRASVASAIASAVESLASRAPGYRLLSGPLFEETDDRQLRVAVVVQIAPDVGGALPPYAGGVEILTRAAVDVGERLALGSVAIA